MKNLLIVILSAFYMTACSQNVRLVQNDNQKKVDVYIGGKLFTSYCYPDTLEKPFLFPVNAPNGAVITRGYPLAPRRSERVDHPHQVGLWFNHGNVNGLDFWNNSSAIPEERKDSYGHISVKEITKVQSGKQGILEVTSDWNDNKGNNILVEKTRYIFSDEGDKWTIDHISTLTAQDGPVTFTDNKEGMFAIRVDRAFEMPSDEALIFTDDKGNQTTVKAVDNTGVTGIYKSSAGLKGDAVWGTRNEWVVLTGTKDNTVISFGIFDNPENPGFPAYAHARGYGLFSVNNLGRKSYDPKQEEVVYNLKKGESMTLKHRFVVKAGAEITSEEADKIFDEFSNTY